MQLVGIARVGPDLLGDPRDRGRVEAGKLVRLDGKTAPQRHRPAAALFQGRVVEIGKRAPVEDLVRQHGRLGGVPHQHADPAGLDAGDQLPQPGDVHRLVQAVGERLPDEHMIGDLHRARRDVLLAGRQRREHRRHQVIGLHPLDRRRVLLPAPHPEHGE